MTQKLLSSSCLVAATFLFCAFTARNAFADEVTLQDHSLTVSFDSDSGALTRMEYKPTHWIIERRPELGVSFRLFAPLPDRRWNPVYGQKQRAEVSKVSDNEVQLKWSNLMSENGGVLPMTFTADVTLNHGVLTFDSTLQNDSSLTVETIDYPYFGDFNPPSRESSLTACTMKNGRRSDMQQQELYPHFVNRKGYWGVFYPTKTFDDYNSMFCLLQAPDQGLYVRMDAPTAPYRLEYTFEQHPGILSSITQLVPKEDEFPGKDSLWGTDENAEHSRTPVFLVFRTCHFVFASGHSTTHLTPVVLRCYQGDAKAGEDLYKQSRSNM
ncbi:MAG TPA: hypothetical protein VNV43_00790 [Candidatus Acidoferrales bacterium]|jgi:hypothetical protein|nr:hypothetical protein [Candidatus Acidoferrales bacterium]